MADDSNWQNDVAFVAAVKTVLLHEGGYTKDSRDSGNWTGGQVGHGVLKGTKYGISAASYPNVDIANLSQEDACAIYYRDWWTRYRYAELSAAVAAKVFDLAVAAPAAAHRSLQRAVRAAHGNPGLDEDGEIGPLTIQGANACNPDLLLSALKSEFAGYCRMVGANKEVTTGQHDPYLVGWLNRAYS